MSTQCRSNLKSQTWRGLLLPRCVCRSMSASCCFAKRAHPTSCRAPTSPTTHHPSHDPNCFCLARCFAQPRQESGWVEVTVMRMHCPCHSHWGIAWCIAAAESTQVRAWVLKLVSHSAELARLLPGPHEAALRLAGCSAALHWASQRERDLSPPGCRSGCLATPMMSHGSVEALVPVHRCLVALVVLVVLVALVALVVLGSVAASFSEQQLS